MISAEEKTTSAPKTDSSAGSGASKPDSTASSGSAPASYSRGEGQKNVTQAYRDNWHAIFAKPERKAAKTKLAKKARTKTAAKKSATKKPGAKMRKSRRA